MKLKLFDDLPEWLDKESWEGFIEMRKVIKKPLTDRALKMILKRLNVLRSQGEDPNAVLDQSTMLCWSNIYPIKEETSSGRNQPKSFQTIRNEGTDAAIRRVLDLSKLDAAKSSETLRPRTGPASHPDLLGAPKRHTN